MSYGIFGEKYRKLRNAKFHPVISVFPDGLLRSFFSIVLLYSYAALLIDCINNHSNYCARNSYWGSHEHDS